MVTAMEAFGLGGFKAGSFTIMNVLAAHSWGKAILILWAAGLFGYVFWRIYESIVDHEEYGTTILGLGQRIGFGFGGVVYGFLAFKALQIVFHSGDDSSYSTSKIQEFIHTDLGMLLVIGISLGMMGGALNEFYIAFTGIFKKTIAIDEVPSKYKNAVMSFGKLGYACRGFTLGIAAYLLLQSAFTTRDISSADKEAAFSFMQYNFGNFILGLIALGFIIYSFYVFVETYYRKIDM